MSSRDRRRTTVGRDAPPAVVIGLDSITGLQTSRILAARGVPVVGIVSDRRHWAARTRACTQVLESAPTAEEVVPTLTRLAARLDRPAVLVPCSDAAVEAVSVHRGELGPAYRLPLSPHDIVATLMDKPAFSRYAAAAGLPVPPTLTLRDRVDASTAAAELRFPCVLKPSTKASEWLRKTSRKGFLVHDGAQLLLVYDRVAGWAPELVAQEWVAGPENGLVSFNGYFDAQGVPLVSFMARKLRQWPPGIGTSSSGAECRDDEALALAVRLFGEAHFHGLAYLEMKRDVRTGQLMIIEANVGRPTGRSAIAEAGGVELVHTAYTDAVGLPLPANRAQQYVGTKWLDLRRDLQAAVVAHRQEGLSARDWWTSVRGPKAHAIWSASDPAPFVSDVIRATAGGVRMLRRPRHDRNGDVRVHDAGGTAAIPGPGQRSVQTVEITEKGRADEQRW